MKLLGSRSLSSAIKILLDIAFYTSIVATLLLAVVVGLATAFGGDEFTEEFPITFDLDPATYRIESRDGQPVTAEIVEASGELRVTRSGGATAVRIVLVFPLLAAIILVVYKLRQIFRRLIEGRPFAPENASTLRFIGFAVIGAEILWAGLVFWMNLLLASEFSTSGVVLRADLGIRMSVILAGLVLLIVAEIFRQGAEMKSDLETAREIQFSLLPSPDFERPAVTIHSRMRPANTVGGDYYDVVELEDGKLALVVADVAGKGIPAALLMALLQGSLRSLLSSGLRGAELVERLNRYLVTNTPDNRMITFFYGELEPATGDLRYVNAGHNPPFLVEPSGLRRLDSTAVVLGVLPGAPFPEETVRLADGARLFIYTDGITEAANAREEEFGEQRLAELLESRRDSAPTGLLDAVLETVVRFCGKARPGDDMTMMIVSRPG